MSKLEQLINKLCPNGVEYRSLEKICKFQNGFAFKSSKFLEFGLPILRITNIVDGKIDNNSLVFFNPVDYSTSLDSYIVKRNNIVIAMSGATTGKIGYNYSDNEYYLNQRVGMFIPQKEKLNNRFLYHWLIGQSKNIYNISSGSGAQPNLSSVKMMSLEIPLPPLPVQEEIVRILDTFTELTTELIAELSMRRQQYEYYRDSLLTFGDETPIFQLNEVAQYSKDRINAIQVDKTTYIGVDNLLQDRQGKTNSNYVPTEGRLTRYEKNNILIGNIRPYLKKIWFSDTCGGTNGDVLVIQPISDKLLPKYLYILLCAEKFFNYNMQNVKGAKMPRGSKDAIMRYSIPLPPLEEQQRIVDILDRFDTLVNDIKTGLPAEIEARQKQYEYYRDKLLTFKKLEREV